MTAEDAAAAEGERRKPKETERTNIKYKQKQKRGKEKNKKDSDCDSCKNTHTPFHIFFSFNLFITTVEIIKLEQHRGAVEEEEISS